MPWFRRRLRLDHDLMTLVEEHVRSRGYATVEEFVSHCVEKELRRHGAESDPRLLDRLRGLGYVD